MNEGKPTKAKWWSRPRPQDHAGEPDGTDQVTAEDPGGSGVHGPETAQVSTGPDGDFELPRPAPRHDTDGDYELRRPEAVPAESAAKATASEPGTAEVGVAGPVQDAPRPLHDPDPYSTPPYGEPGPWAPAPPVQHPATIPAQGVATPGQPTLPGTAAVSPPPEPHGTPSASATGHAAP
ncbi:protease, partial [Streptomyces tibetensis]